MRYGACKDNATMENSDNCVNGSTTLQVLVLKSVLYDIPGALQDENHSLRHHTL